MIKDKPSKQKNAADSHMGGDGWFTLLLSTALIGMTGGLTLLWQTRVVLGHARNTPATTDDQIELVLIPCVQLANDQPNPDFHLRLGRGVQLHQTHGMPLMLMGGYTGGSKISEAQAGIEALARQGIPAKSLLREESSRNTLENLRNAREQLRQLNLNNIALVSNRYHLARCKALANGLGLNPYLCAAESTFSISPRLWPRLLLEAYYLHWYHTGRIWSRLTRNRHSLARIS